MKRTELKTAIRNADIVEVYSRTLDNFVQANKSKLLKLLDNLPKDSTWLNYCFNEKTMNDKRYLFINWKRIIISTYYSSL